MIRFLRNERRYMLLAIGFFTRIPVPHFHDFHPDELNRSAKYFPLVGMFVGMIGAGAFVLASKFLPNSIALLISMAMTIYVTGAFHEDGLADSADGLGERTMSGAPNACSKSASRRLSAEAAMCSRAAARTMEPSCATVANRCRV